jgi:Ca-activated chloride channel homolog
VRYISGISGKILASQAITLTEFQITLEAAEEATAGAPVEITWTGPGYESDFITIVPKGTEDGKYEKWAYTKAGSPLSIEAPYELGAAEIRYMNEQGNVVLARRPITIVKGGVTMKAAAEANKGSTVSIEWSGPDNKGDFITIVPKDMEDGKYAKWAYTKSGNPAEVEAPYETGAAEIRYMNETGNIVLARIPITITEGKITLEAPAEAVSGSAVSIKWEGPDNKGDFITIVPKGTEDGKYEKWAYTTAGNPLEVIASFTPGDAEIRYMNETGNIVLARTAIKITAPVVTLKSAAQAIAGEPVAIEWTGPDNNGDFITIVPKGTEDGQYEGWAYTNTGSPTNVTATATPGEAEIRYMNEDGNRVLARAAISIIAAEE